MKIAMAAEMQQLDRIAIDRYGIPGIVLMENAGHGTISFMEDLLGSLQGTTVVIFIGPGNNGGDGLVIARRIHQRGGHPFIIFSLPPERLKGDAATNAVIVDNLKLPSIVLPDPFAAKNIVDAIIDRHCKYPVSCLVDALFGTGLVRDITGHMAEIIHLINSLGREYEWPVLAVDLPSGRDADTGRILGAAIDADLTATYGLAKPAHFLHGGAGLGRLHIVDIGIPGAALQQVQLRSRALTAAVADNLPDRSIDSHKGNYGHLLVVAGSEGKTGAALLCCRAALTSGCGLVTSAVPHALNPIFENNLLEAMTLTLPASATVFSINDYDRILAATTKKSAIIVGPGIGTANETKELILRMYREITLPMVIDADALNILAQDHEALAHPGGPRILTPHPGEMSRLTGLSTEKIQHDRTAAAVGLCRESGQETIIVLKGAGTIIADNHGNLAVNTSGNPGMATGGMGDVLSGLLGSLLAQKVSPWSAACTGVYLHGLAADILAREKTYGYQASEVAATLPAAIRECQQQTGEEQ
jgi:NAD(P)H-hydrate epimerase